MKSENDSQQWLIDDLDLHNKGNYYKMNEQENTIVGIILGFQKTSIVFTIRERNFEFITELKSNSTSLPDAKQLSLFSME